MIQFAKLYRHIKTGNHYAILGIGRVKVNDKWVEAVNYRPIACVDDVEGRIIVQELYTRPAKEFYEKFEITDHRNDGEAGFEHLREAMDGMPGADTFQRLHGALYNSWAHLKTVRSLEASIAQLDTEGLITGMLQRVYEYKYEHVKLRTLRELLDPPSVPRGSGFPKRTNPVMDLLLLTMALRLKWKVRPAYRTDNALEREYFNWVSETRVKNPNAKDLLLEICEYSSNYL